MKEGRIRYLFWAHCAQHSTKEWPSRAEVCDYIRKGPFYSQWKELSSFLEKCSMGWSSNTAIKLKHVMMKVSNGLSPFQQFFRNCEEKSILLSLQKFGDECIVTNDEKIKAKLDNHAKPWIWLDYVDNHAMNTYHLLH